MQFRDTYSFRLHENNRTTSFLPNFKWVNIFTIDQRFLKLKMAHAPQVGVAKSYEERIEVGRIIAILAKNFWVRL